MTKIATNNQEVTLSAVQAALYARGTNLKRWCESHNFSYTTATHAVERHTGGKARTPWGPKTRQILAALSQETGMQLLPN